MKFDTGEDSNEYELEVIWDSAIYTRESESGHLLALYFLVLKKRYAKEENTWKLVSVVQHLRKLISSFYKDYHDKPTATSLVIDNAPLMARPTVRPIIKLSKPLKQKQEEPANSTNKRAKN